MLEHAPRWWVTTSVVLLIAGIVLLSVFGTDEVIGVVGGAVLSLGAILGIGVAFYAVGRSEDRARARETNPLA